MIGATALLLKGNYHLPAVAHGWESRGEQDGGCEKRHSGDPVKIGKGSGSRAAALTAVAQELSPRRKSSKKACN